MVCCLLRRLCLDFSDSPESSAYRVVIAKDLVLGALVVNRGAGGTLLSMLALGMKSA